VDQTGRVSTGPGPRRIVGVDVARCLALLGMITAHLVDAGRDGPPSGWFQLVSGRSSALFAVLAGVSLALVSDPARGPVRYHRRQVAVRALLVALIGLFLGSLPSGLAVILTYYGVLFLLALPVLRWRARSLALLAVAWAVLSPVVSQLLRPHLPPTSHQVPELVSLADPWQLVTELLVTGYYPVLTWGTYLFAGMAAARAGLHRPEVARWLLVFFGWTAVLTLGAARWLTGLPQAREALLASWDRGGPVATWEQLQPLLAEGLYGTAPTGSWWWLAVWAPHSGSVVDLVHTTSFALAVLGLALVLVRMVGRERFWRVAFGAGTLTLTLYSVHVAVRSLGPDVPLAWSLPAHLVGVLAIGAGFVLAGRRGPLESLVGSLARGGPPVRDQSGTGWPR
jgi:hypothetical protein